MLQYIVQAAEQGYSKARHTLGELFFEGTSWLKKNLTDILQWYKQAAEQGHTKAIQHVATHGLSKKEKEESEDGAFRINTGEKITRSGRGLAGGV